MRSYNESHDWIPLVLENSWVTYSSSYPVPSYRVVDGWVHLRGLVKDGTVDADITSLPPQLAPLKVAIFATISNNAIGRITVFTDGDVASNAINNNSWVSLEGIRWEIQR